MAGPLFVYMETTFQDLNADYTPAEKASIQSLPSIEKVPDALWVRTLSPEFSTYQLVRDESAEPELVHIFATGYSDYYTLVFEDGYDNHNARTEYLSAARIFTTYNIQIN